MINQESKQDDTGPDHVLAGKGGFLGGFDGVLLRTAIFVLQSQLDSVPDVNGQQQAKNGTEADDDRKWERVKVVSVSVDSSVEPTKDS